MATRQDTFSPLTATRAHEAEHRRDEFIHQDFESDCDGSRTDVVPEQTGPGFSAFDDDLLSRGRRPTQNDPRAARFVAADLPCRSLDPSGGDLFFAESPSDLEAAKALCRSCPLSAECLAGAVERREPWGVWGGEIFVDGVPVRAKRGRGRPRKAA